ncbi:tripartite tricarboxylate transporter substrate binding protein [Xylophilus sp. GOD-11R]|uniref:Bug family tripartite tricarboxylate transporter substrate binding protein n=1 Tax=Xylophilus sp. GOD-11R TaxID=3089814 RepID=UPI00298C5C46|nr:tripartite tricarboxylate transporter substrate binding protein [Xylophilus sp. GOD-11R]WPB56120.1 tripartite tricarboxylate transporter substrate binding protein [Xylophilus sp. GOD-11R]
MNKLFRSLTLVAAGIAAFAAVCAPAAAEDYPNKPIKLIVPFPPGGSVDMIGRLVGQKLSDALGQPVLVDNRAGAGGNIGMDFVAKAPKDGYTLLVAPSGYAANQHLFAKLPFDPMKDLTPIIRIADQPAVLIANPKLPVKNVKELAAYAKANPGKVSFGTSGVGGAQDVAARLFMSMTGTDMLNVAYRGGAPALADLLAGQIDIMFETSPTAVPYAKSGKLIPLAVTTDKRIANLPDVPTVAESGLPGFHSVTWIGMAAPGGTPAAVVAKLNAQMQKVLADPAVRKQIGEISLDIAGGSAEDFAKFLQKESADYAKFVKDNNITPQ